VAEPKAAASRVVLRAAVVRLALRKVAVAPPAAAVQPAVRPMPAAVPLAVVRVVIHLPAVPLAAAVAQDLKAAAARAARTVA
jgi:hypothetical protein